MLDTGLILYVLLIAILLLFLRAAGRPSLEKMLDHNVQAHERVHRMLAKHPGGGTWKEVKRWLAEESEGPKAPPAKAPDRPAGPPGAPAQPGSPLSG